jgi:cytochrome c-type biogenesis protein
MLDWTLVAGALWLGILTSISPCPLATNIAAVAFLSRRGAGAGVAWSCAAYIAGRMLAYTLLAAVLAAGIVSAPGAAAFFRVKAAGLVGPGLILVGMVVAGWLPMKIPGLGGINSLGIKLAERGFAGEFLMGMVFALAFCPVSAALFFGGLLPGIIKSGATVSLAVTYGIGTALPVIAAVIFLTAGVGLASQRLRRLQNLGGWLQTGTAWVLIAAGVWLTLRDLLG